MHQLVYSLQNKWEHISERELDIVLDHLNTLNDLTPKIQCSGRNGVDPDLIFGIDSKVFLEGTEQNMDMTHNDEVETVTVYKGPWKDRPHSHHGDHEDPGSAHYDHNHHDGVNRAEATGGFKDGTVHGTESVERQHLLKVLEGISKESIWRVKGFVVLEDGLHILNWAFGRFDLTKIDESRLTGQGSIRFTIMGERGEVKRASKKFAAALGAEIQ